MHATDLLAYWLAQHTVIRHRAREAALLKLVQALLGGSKLSLTQLGRHRAGSAYTKHHIKAADRLLGVKARPNGPRLDRPNGSSDRERQAQRVKLVPVGSCGSAKRIAL